MTPRFSATLSQSANIPALTSNTGTINIGGHRDDYFTLDKSISVSASGSIANSGGVAKYINHVMHGTAGSDQFHGTAGNDTMYGDDGGNDSYILTGGSDKAYGGNASDLFFIESGNHMASGAGGNDTFQIEGAGNHRLTGGSGADSYLFLDASHASNGAPGFSGHTTITDFNWGESDHITFVKPVAGWGWNNNHTVIDFTFTDGSSVSVQLSVEGGDDSHIFQHIQFGF